MSSIIKIADSVFVHQDQGLKLAADTVLCEVRKKQADVKRMQDILRSLEKLRRLRKEAASRKGERKLRSAATQEQWVIIRHLVIPEMVSFVEKGHHMGPLNWLF